jgi:hypothetical protein
VLTAPQESEVVVLKVYVLRSNIDRMIKASDNLEESRTEVVNRALPFYSLVMTAKRFTWISWRDVWGNRHKVWKTR